VCYGLWHNNKKGRSKSMIDIATLAFEVGLCWIVKKLEDRPNKKGKR